MQRPSRIPLVDETDPLFSLLKAISTLCPETLPALKHLQQLTASDDEIFAARLKSSGSLDFLLRLSTSADEEVSSLSASILSNLCGPAARGERERIVTAGPFQIRIRELSYLSAGLGFKIWPSANLLNRLLLERKIAPTVKSSVLELGSGTGITGILCHRLGFWRVDFLVLTDYMDILLENIRSNVSLNATREENSSGIEVKLLDWYSVAQGSQKITERFPLIIGADLVYDKDGPAKALIEVFRHTLELSAEARVELVLPTAKIRYGVSEFESLLANERDCPFYISSRVEYQQTDTTGHEDEKEKEEDLILTHYTIKWRDK